MLLDRVRVMVAVVSFLAMFFLNVPYPFIVLGAGLAGLCSARARGDACSRSETVVLPRGEGVVERPPVLARSLRTVCTGLLVWFAPLLLVRATLGPTSRFLESGLFFSSAAVVTFGGAYSVLGYVAHHAVEVHGWLGPGEMMDGLGLAETTPGPLILVLEFVGFVACSRDPGPFSPWMAGALGAGLTIWVTFVPSFLWIFVGAPYVESLRGDPRVESTLASITAAVVGVVLDLALWFGLHVLFGAVEERSLGPVSMGVPDIGSLDVQALLLAMGAGYMLLRRKAGMLATLGACALGGVAIRALLH